MGVGREIGVGRSRWPVGVLAAVAGAIALIWLLGWRAEPGDGPAATTSSSPTTTAPAESFDGRVDIMGVVVAVTPGAAWDAPPTGDCPSPDLGPRPEDCPRIGPATLVLATGGELEVPAGTPGDPELWDLAHPGEGAPAGEAFIVAGLRDERTVSWVYVLAAGDLPDAVDLTAGAIRLIADDGWAETETGWSYRLEATLRTSGCEHLRPWTLAGPQAEGRADWMARRALLATWDGPQRTRLDLTPVGRATARTVGAITCTDLLDWRGDPDPLTTLAAARELWALRSDTDYRFRFATMGDWPSGRRGTWDVTVIRGTPDPAVLVLPPAVTTDDSTFTVGFAPTIDRLFQEIEAALTVEPAGADACADPSYWVARYDPDEGYPTSFAYDSPACAGEERSWQVDGMQWLYAGFPTCTGWEAIDPQTGVTAHWSPYPIWQGGLLEVGETWRYEITIDGCGFPFLRFNELWWKQVSRSYTPGTTGEGPGLGEDFAARSYPAGWPACILAVHGGPLLQVYGHITRVDTGTIEASTLEGDLIAVYEPTDEEPPYCGE